MVRTLFLDFDGVLNTDRSRSTFGKDHINLDVVRSLASMLQDLDNTGCPVRVVVSSTWRRHHLNDGVAGLCLASPFLKLLALHHDPMTPDMPGAARGDEVLAWLARNPATAGFAILDDLSVIPVLPENQPSAQLLQAHTLLVDGRKGFGTPAHLEELGRLLQMPFHLPDALAA